MKSTKSLAVKTPNKDLFDNPFIDFKEWDKDYAYDNLSFSIDKTDYHSDSFVKDDKDYSKW